MDIKVKTVEILNKTMNPDIQQIISPIIIDVLADLPLMQVWNWSYILRSQTFWCHVIYIV